MEASVLPNMQRILITGNAGSGKTSLAKAVAATLNLPYVGLDRVVWNPGWVSTPRHDREVRESAIARSQTWVVDGVSITLLREAETVIFLDIPRYKCFWRVLWRNLPYLFRSRPELPDNRPEIKIIPTLVRIIWRFPKLVKPRILEAKESTGKQFFHIRNNAELKLLSGTLNL